MEQGAAEYIHTAAVAQATGSWPVFRRFASSPQVVVAAYVRKPRAADARRVLWRPQLVQVAESPLSWRFDSGDVLAAAGRGQVHVRVQDVAAQARRIEHPHQRAGELGALFQH